MKSAKYEMLSDEQLENAAEMLKMMAHPCRLRLLQLIEKGSVPVNALVEMTGSRQATVSGHLRRMKICGVVEAEHRGREVWYSLSNPCALSLLKCMTKYYAKPAIKQEVRI